MMSVFRAVTMGAALMVGGIALGVPAQAQECRSIADPTARLACYDRQQGSVSSPSSPSATPESPSQNQTGLRDTSAPNPPKARAGFSSTISAITPTTFGLYELRLADGSVWSTTTSGGFPPQVGDRVTYRRSMLGAHFFDIKGRRSITVRRER